MPISLGLDHVTLPVTDLGVAEAFYVVLLGAKLGRRFDRETFLKHRPDRAVEVDAPNSPLHLALTFGPSTPELQLFLQPEGEPRAERGHPHVAFSVSPEDLDRAKEALEKRGVPVDGPMRLGGPGHASIYFLDPFGNHLELVTTAYPGEAPLRVPQYARLTYRWR